MGLSILHSTPPIPIPSSLQHTTNNSETHDILIFPAVVSSDFTNHHPYEALFRTYKFGSFIDAFAFMAQVASWAERLQHHPEWHNVFDRVGVVWRTREVDGLSGVDIEMARICDMLYVKFCK